jgi:hypothetical protein
MAHGKEEDWPDRSTLARTTCGESRLEMLAGNAAFSLLLALHQGGWKLSSSTRCVSSLSWAWLDIRLLGEDTLQLSDGGGVLWQMLLGDSESCGFQARLFCGHLLAAGG